MRLKLLIIIGFLVFGGVLRADTITGTVTGYIGGEGPSTATTDTYGLFGRAGADLYGDSVTVKYSYNTADFQSGSAICMNCTEYDSFRLSSSEFISFTVNGQTQSFSPSYRSELVFENATASFPYNLFVEGIDNSAGQTGVVLGLGSANNVAFGQAIVPGGNLYNSISFIIPSTGGYTIGETFDFVSTMPATPSPAPEPSSIVLVGTGLLGMAGVLKRRFGPKRTI